MQRNDNGVRGRSPIETLGDDALLFFANCISYKTQTSRYIPHYNIAGWRNERFVRAYVKARNVIKENSATGR